MSRHNRTIQVNRENSAIRMPRYSIQLTRQILEQDMHILILRTVGQKMGRKTKILLLLLLTLASSCGSYISGGKGGGGNNNNGTVYLNVDVVTPTNSEVGVALNSIATATFNEAVDTATVNTASFTLQVGTKVVEGTVIASGKTATFTPTSALSQNTTYIAEITTDVKAISGHVLASNYTWIFTTARDYSAWIDVGINYEAPAGASAYYPSVLYDANCFGTIPCNAGTPKYYMWYSDGGGSSFLVQSVNGLQWGAPTTMLGLVNSHHVQVLYDANCFGTVPCNVATTKYRIWFWDITRLYASPIAISTAESADGINWINQQAITQNAAAKLVQDPDLGVGWNRGSYGPVNLFYQPSASNTGTEPWNYRYVMYYDGTNGSTEDTGLAYSTDGLYWSAYSATPVLDGSLVGAWDCESSVYGTVYKDSVGYHYFYSGRGEDDGFGGCAFPASGSFDGIGYASSTDGKTFLKSATNPIFHVNDGAYYRNERIYTPSILDDGSGVLRMYYTAKEVGGPKKIGLAILH